MLISVVILFLICQFPVAGMLIYTSVRDIPYGTREYYVSLGLNNIFNFGVAVNAACNFVLYCLLCQKYRRTLVKLFCPCLKVKLSRLQSSYHHRTVYSKSAGATASTVSRSAAGSNSVIAVTAAAAAAGRKLDSIALKPSALLSASSKQSPVQRSAVNAMMIGADIKLNSDFLPLNMFNISSADDGSKLLTNSKQVTLNGLSSSSSLSAASSNLCHKSCNNNNSNSDRDHGHQVNRTTDHEVADSCKCKQNSQQHSCDCIVDRSHSDGSNRNSDDNNNGGHNDHSGKVDNGAYQSNNGRNINHTKSSSGPDDDGGGDDRNLPLPLPPPQQQHQQQQDPYPNTHPHRQHHYCHKHFHNPSKSKISAELGTKSEKASEAAAAAVIAPSDVAAGSAVVASICTDDAVKSGHDKATESNNNEQKPNHSTLATTATATAAAATMAATGGSDGDGQTFTESNSVANPNPHVLLNSSQLK